MLSHISFSSTQHTASIAPQALALYYSTILLHTTSASTSSSQYQTLTSREYIYTRASFDTKLLLCMRTELLCALCCCGSRLTFRSILYLYVCLVQQNEANRFSCKLTFELVSVFYSSRSLLITNYEFTIYTRYTIASVYFRVVLCIGSFLAALFR